MIVAQVVLITPIVAALSRQVVTDLWTEYEEQMRSLGLTPRGAVPTLLWDGRYSPSTAVLAGFGRPIAAVRPLIHAGGNFTGYTPPMTTPLFPAGTEDG